MDSAGNSQGDDGSYQDPSYYEGMDSSLDPDYTGDFDQRSPLREQDRFLPIANVAKIMKRSVPNNGKIAKEAKECVQECVSEFISFITSEAAERCINEKRKTVNGEDIMYAISTLGFDNYNEPIRKFLLKYREASKMDTSMFEDPTSLASTSGLGLNAQGQMAVIYSIPPSLQAAATQPGSTPIAARPITVLQTTDSGDQQPTTITIGGQQYTQQVILTHTGSNDLTATLAPAIIKPEPGGPEEVKFANQQGTIQLVPFTAGGHQIALLNGQQAVTTAVTTVAITAPATVASTSAT